MLVESLIIARQRSLGHRGFSPSGVTPARRHSLRPSAIVHAAGWVVETSVQRSKTRPGSVLYSIICSFPAPLPIAAARACKQSRT